MLSHDLLSSMNLTHCDSVPHDSWLEFFNRDRSEKHWDPNTRSDPMVGTAYMAQQVPGKEQGQPCICGAACASSLGKCLWDSFVFKEKVVVVWGDGSIGKEHAA